MDTIREKLKYDFIFCDQLDAITEKIISKGLIQYLSTYKVIDLHQLTKEF